MVPVKSCSKGTPLSEETWLPSNWEAVVSKAAERCLCVQRGTAAIKADKRWNVTSSLGVCSYSEGALSVVQHCHTLHFISRY